ACARACATRSHPCARTRAARSRCAAGAAHRSPRRPGSRPARWRWATSTATAGRTWSRSIRPPRACCTASATAASWRGGGAALALSGARRARLLDLDGDGLLDLVTLETAGLVLRPGDGAGGFGAPVVTALAGGCDFATGDFDADGRMDVAMLAFDSAGGRL